MDNHKLPHEWPREGMKDIRKQADILERAQRKGKQMMTVAPWLQNVFDRNDKQVRLQAAIRNPDIAKQILKLLDKIGYQTPLFTGHEETGK